MALQAMDLNKPADMAVSTFKLMEITPKNTHVYPAPITQTMINRPQDPPLGTPGTPVISAIDPTTVKSPSEDVVVNVFGSGFFPTSIITIGGADVAETDFVSSVQLQTTVSNPQPGTYAFKVRNAAALSVASMNLTVT